MKDKQNNKHIALAYDSNMILPSIPNEAKSVLLIGSWENVLGVWDVAMPFGSTTFSENLLSNILPFLQKKGHKITFICDKETKEYALDILSKLGKWSDGLNIPEPKKQLNFIDIEWLIKYNNEQSINVLARKNMKFDYIIQNPPYDGSLHLDFFNLGLDVLSKNGKMVIIEPSRWLIDFRCEARDANLYNGIKQRISGHVESVVIENLNNEFNVSQHIPFSTTTIDMSKTFDAIDFYCFGEHKQVKSLYDCNLIGNYSLIHSIINKCRMFQHGNVMKNHITQEQLKGNYCYTKYIDMNARIGCIMGTTEKRESIEKYGYYNGFLGSYFSNCYFVPLLSDNIVNDIYDTIPKRLANGYNYSKPKWSDKNADCVYGTKDELENWKYFIFNNKLPLFINICLTFDQNNVVKDFVPWLVDRRYTDDEINQIFGFTDEEIKLINLTLKKFKRDSPWYKRYTCGKEFATDEEVSTYLNGITSC